MYEDGWYTAFVPSSQAVEDKSTQPKHYRRVSLLKQPNDHSEIEPTPSDGIAAVPEEAVGLGVPPPATVARRAKSYSDFYDAMRSQLKKDLEDGHIDKGVHSTEIKTELDFADWYHSLEFKLEDSNNEEYRLYHDQLLMAESHLDSLLSSTSSALDLLNSLSISFESVEAQTAAFQAQCEGLTSEQRRVSKLADDIGGNLQYYNSLEPITRRMNASGAGGFVRAKEYSEMLHTLDRCLEYMGSHPNHHDAHTYRSRYRLLLTRGLTLVRVHFVSSLRDIASDVTKRIADRQLNDTTMSALLYAKFRVGAPELKRVGQEIRKRAMPIQGIGGGEVEYQNLVNELYQNYSATRGKLVIPLVRKKVNEIAMAPSTSKDLVAFARSSIGYIRGVCVDEWTLWREWLEGEDGLYNFLESICEPLYDHLRPRIIHENKLLRLCELCTLLQTRYMHDQEDDQDPIDESQLDFSPLIQPALEDAQTRLVFRTQAILRDEIENYRPKPHDLDFPARNQSAPLSGTKSRESTTHGRKYSVTSPTESVPKTPRIIEEDGDMEEKDSRWEFDTEAVFQGWYPTLRKAIWLLSKIYRLVNSTVFDDLAHQIVHLTTVSLHKAASLISSKSSATDSQLFLIKYLLILKSQIVAFDIEFVTPEVSFDFSVATNTFWELRERGGLFNPRNLLRLVGGGLLPRVVENMLDAKVELDGRLRKVINDFTTGFATRMTIPIAEKAVAKGRFDSVTAVKAAQDAIQKEVPLLRRKLDEYLPDARTKETLVGAVQDLVMENYEEFYVKHVSGTAKNGKVSRKGKGRDDETWDVDTFAEWASGVFRVDRAGMSGMDDESRSRSVSRNGSM
ncbi:MAG: Golgi transport complex subunit 3 [Geoglossum simile]|nr:MAG: Golgi transport complex subunit 3 [Geoglossum simile]